MVTDDVRFYLIEFHRLLKTGGKMYVTAFIEEDVPEIEKNPPHYIEESTGPLHRVRYENRFFLHLIEETGFLVEKFEHQKISRTKQSVVVSVKQ